MDTDRKKNSHHPWLLAATGCILVIIAIMLMKYRRTKTAVESKARPTDANHTATRAAAADVCYREPVWARVPPKVHWSTCQADWCRPL